jgi:hypothetical protein
VIHPIQPYLTVEPLAASDVGALHDAYFDHRTSIKTEVDIFIREHEVRLIFSHFSAPRVLVPLTTPVVTQTKRGNLDIDKLNAGNKSLENALQSVEECKAFGDLNLNKLVENSSSFLTIALSLLTSCHRYNPTIVLLPCVVKQSNKAVKQQLALAPEFMVRLSSLVVFSLLLEIHSNSKSHFAATRLSEQN